MMVQPIPLAGCVDQFSTHLSVLLSNSFTLKLCPTVVSFPSHLSFRPFSFFLSVFFPVLPVSTYQYFQYFTVLPASTCSQTLDPAYTSSWPRSPCRWTAGTAPRPAGRSPRDRRRENKCCVSVRQFQPWNCPPLHLYSAANYITKPNLYSTQLPCFDNKSSVVV